MSAAPALDHSRLGLVLTRLVDERIVIRTPAGDRIVLTVCRITPNEADPRKHKVRIAILAPTSHAIHRAEVLEAIEVEHARRPA